MKNGIEDGWYYIKLDILGAALDFTAKMEALLPPSRCVQIIGGEWEFYDMKPEMIEAPAFKIGDEVQVKDNIEAPWKNVIFAGYAFWAVSSKTLSSDGSAWDHCQRKPHEKIEITVKINGTQTELSDDMQDRILECLATNNKTKG